MSLRRAQAHSMVTCSACYSPSVDVPLLSLPADAMNLYCIQAGCRLHDAKWRLPLTLIDTHLQQVHFGLKLTCDQIK
jgi:hypothetical protein